MCGGAFCGSGAHLCGTSCDGAFSSSDSNGVCDDSAGACCIGNGVAWLHDALERCAGHGVDDHGVGDDDCAREQAGYILLR